MSVAFIDVSAGHDTEPHSFRLRKQQMIGYAESTLDWVASYLRGRTMRVRINSRGNKEGSATWWARKSILVEGLYTEHSNDSMHVKRVGGR